MQFEHGEAGSGPKLKWMTFTWSLAFLSLASAAPTWFARSVTFVLWWLLVISLDDGEP